MQKFEYLENEKSFLDEIKNISHRNKNFLKNSGHKVIVQPKFLFNPLSTNHTKWSITLEHFVVDGFVGLTKL